MQLQSVPVILHCLPGDCPTFMQGRFQPEFIEKRGNSVTALKKKINDALTAKKASPIVERRF